MYLRDDKRAIEKNLREYCVCMVCKLTDKKENKIFLEEMFLRALIKKKIKFSSYKEFQSGAVIYEEGLPNI
jgi:hypothetical protein